MRRHSSAQRRHASAQRRQWSMSWRAHSAPHDSQTSAHASQMRRECWLPRAMKATARRQSSAQSTSRAMHLASGFGSGSCRQEEAQWSQASAQELHASTQEAYCSGAMSISFDGVAVGAGTREEVPCVRMGAMSRRNRVITAVLAAAMLLFAQLSVSAYSCPMAVPAHEMAQAGCDEEMGSVNLCERHCDYRSAPFEAAQPLQASPLARVPSPRI